MVEELLHYFCCFECNSLFAIGCVKGCSKHVSSVVAAAKYCSPTPCRFHPFSKHPISGGFANGGLRFSSATVHDCPLQTIVATDLLQSPRTPKPQKCILQSEKCHLGPPKKWPQKSIKMSKNVQFWEIKMAKNGLFRHFN